VRWDTSCPDWEDRILAGRSLIPDLPLFEASAQKGLRIFKRLRVPDIAGNPTLAEACGEWFLPLVLALFGSLDPQTQIRMIQEYFLLVPKGNSKTSYGGALMTTALIMNERPEAEFHLIAPTIQIANYAFKQGVGTINLDDDLKRLFHTQPSRRAITHRLTGSVLIIKAADTDVITGGKQVGTFIDETHVLARKSNAADIMVEIRGALGKRPDGFLLQATTQSKDPPHGQFATELHQARDVRDGKLQLPLLPVLYELPRRVIVENGWKDRKYWPLVNPNFGRSVNEGFLADQVLKAEREGSAQLALIASQHFNVEIGIGLRTDGWPGGEFWLQRVDKTLTVQALIERCEVIVVGVDGGGLDDLFGLAVLGRERGTRRWLLWSHAWAHRIVLERRKSIAPQLLDFEKAGELTFVNAKDDEMLGDMTEIVGIVGEVKDAGLLNCVVLDVEGPYGELVDALDEIDVTEEGGQIKGVRQGIFLMGAIKGTERKLANGTLIHNGTSLMTWCVANLKIEATATAIRATKQNAGDKKIDPVMALFDAASIMQTNPDAVGTSHYRDHELRVL